VNIDHNWIAAHIPHQGDMCLLNAVEAWNEAEIVCTASSHRLADNPLRAAGQLGITTGIEYAAQAMAVHGALLACDDTAPTAGYLTSVREVRWQRPRLDDIAGDLTVRAERISGNEVNVLYNFSIAGAGEVLLSGRASVMLKVASP
jgi:predicted hotdog family 3-hydroxylacyl-ACP dehydratase